MDGRGIVVSIKGDKASVRVSGDAGCEGCAGKTQCFSSGRQGREITVLNDYDAGVSDRVAFEADPGKVALSAVLVWMVPLLGMIAGYVAGERLGGGFIPIATAFLFMVFAFALLKLLDRAISGGRSFYPRITAVLDSGDDASACGER